MRDEIALEARDMVMQAAMPVRPGENIKAQIGRAVQSLGYRADQWRVREAWHGRAGKWSAEAFETLRARYRAWDEKQKQLADAADLTLATRMAALAGSLEREDAEFHQADIDRLRDAARRLGAG